MGSFIHIFKFTVSIVVQLLKCMIISYSYSQKTDPTIKRCITFSSQFTERVAHVQTIISLLNIVRVSLYSTKFVL